MGMHHQIYTCYEMVSDFLFLESSFVVAIYNRHLYFMFSFVENLVQ